MSNNYKTNGDMNMDIQSLKDKSYQIKENIYKGICPFQIEAWVTKEPLPYSDRKSGTYKKLNVGDKWGEELFDCAWFRFSCDVPEECIDERLFALLDISGEMLVVDKNGNSVEGLTNQNSVFSKELGKPGKISYELPKKGETFVEIWADGGLNDLFGAIQDEGKILRASLVIRNEKLHQLWFDFLFLTSLIEAMEDDSEKQKKLILDLKEATDILKSFSDSEISQVTALLQPHLNTSVSVDRQDKTFQVSAVGHAHLDLAWLWPIRETIRKGARTFATALRSMERYDEYVFGASQPQLYVWIKEYYPDLYEKIKVRIAEGRWDVQGGLWTECDTNLVSSESLIRQLVYGIRFFEEEFGIKVNNFMLPDAFGFSAALPQIMSLSGIEFFITMKPAWNLINKFPYHSFIWKGIDGSEIPSHIIPEGTYNGRGTARSFTMTKDNYREKDVSDHALVLYGIGDGGGGPGLEHIESLRRSSRCAELPKVRQERVGAFYKRWIKQRDSFPIWNDEIYLERHQGTFTSQGRTKKMNRSTEHSLFKAEFLAVVSNILTNKKFDSDERHMIKEIWKETLLYQFHDILPGSSIKRVYDEIIPRYVENLKTLNGYINNKISLIAKLIQTNNSNPSKMYMNFTSFQRDEWVNNGENWNKVSMAPMAFAFSDSIDKSTNNIAVSTDKTGTIENEFFKLTFSLEGWINSIWDKKSKREVLSSEGRGNLLSVYQDDGDCWDFPLDYRSKLISNPKLESVLYKVEGPCVSAHMNYIFGDSTIEQEVRLTSGSKRIDFITKADWKDEAKMLRVGFDVNVLSRVAAYEIQGGYIERPTHDNTSWDKAKEEVPAQRWADLSQADKGVALLNDCKYGHRIKGNTMELTLLRSSQLPRVFVDVDSTDRFNDCYTDLEDHEFTYSLFPHNGNDLKQVIREASFLNSPIEIYNIDSSITAESADFSFFRTDNDAVIIQSVKPAEDNNSIIIRLYESIGGDVDCSLSLYKTPSSAFTCDLLEESGEHIPVIDGKLQLHFKPFQIITIKLEY
ncbi:MAG: glycosyl hydrolase-related protein [Spirochaetaceae bacterium]